MTVASFPPSSEMQINEGSMSRRRCVTRIIVFLFRVERDAPTSLTDHSAPQLIYRRSLGRSPLLEALVQHFGVYVLTARSVLLLFLGPHPLFNEDFPVQMPACRLVRHVPHNRISTIE